jgi:hypothetical protein
MATSSHPANFYPEISRQFLKEHDQLIHASTYILGRLGLLERKSYSLKLVTVIGMGRWKEVVPDVRITLS